jgi:hypothetical protein
MRSPDLPPDDESPLNQETTKDYQLTNDTLGNVGGSQTKEKWRCVPCSHLCASDLCFGSDYIIQGIDLCGGSFDFSLALSCA